MTDTEPDEPAPTTSTRTKVVVVAVLAVIAAAWVVGTSDSETTHPVDAETIQTSLDLFADRYSNGNYQAATILYSPETLRACGGSDGTAAALEQLHQVEQIDYAFDVEEMWDDEPKADVAVTETWPDGEETMTLGLGPFVRLTEDGIVRLDDLFPLGMRTYC